MGLLPKPYLAGMPSRNSDRHVGIRDGKKAGFQQPVLKSPEILTHIPSLETYMLPSSISTPHYL